MTLRKKRSSVVKKKISLKIKDTDKKNGKKKKK